LLLLQAVVVCREMVHHHLFLWKGINMVGKPVIPPASGCFRDVSR